MIKYSAQKNVKGTKNKYTEKNNKDIKKLIHKWKTRSTVFLGMVMIKNRNCIKINSKWIKYLNIGAKTIKLRRRHRNKSYDLIFCHGF